MQNYNMFVKGVPMKSTNKQPQPTRPPALIIFRKEAEGQLTSRIELGKKILTLVIRTEDELKTAKNEYFKWDGYNKELLRRIFDSPELSEEYSYWGFVTVSSLDLKYEIEELMEQANEKIKRLESIVEKLPLYPEPPQGTLPREKLEIKPVQKVKTVFVVHGRNETFKDTVARFLEKLQLEPIILHEQANKGQTILEKLEEHSSVAFAIILLTPDDVGGLASERDKLTPRARQNVIFELGYFIGKLGRKNVCALYGKNVELPSNYSGVLYIPLENGDSWKLTLAKEIKAAGLDVDLNKAID